MKRALMSAVVFAFLLMLLEPLAAQDLASSIVGTWKLTKAVLIKPKVTKLSITLISPGSSRGSAQPGPIKWKWRAIR